MLCLPWSLRGGVGQSVLGLSGLRLIFEITLFSLFTMGALSFQMEISSISHNQVSGAMGNDYPHFGGYPPCPLNVNFAHIHILIETTKYGKNICLAISLCLHNGPNKQEFSIIRVGCTTWKRMSWFGCVVCVYLHFPGRPSGIACVGTKASWFGQ